MYPRSGENLLLILKLLHWSDLAVDWFDASEVRRLTQQTILT